MNKKIIITLCILALAIIAFLAFKPKTVQEAQTSTDSTVNSYTLDEVALHNTKDDCWMAINGKVINPTPFIQAGQHPNDKILNGCGKDATVMFENVGKHDGGKAMMALEQYEIGVLK